MTGFIVDSNTPGVSFGDKLVNMGQRCSGEVLSLVGLISSQIPDPSSLTMLLFRRRICWAKRALVLRLLWVPLTTLVPLLPLELLVSPVVLWTRCLILVDYCDLCLHRLQSMPRKEKPWEFLSTNTRPSLSCLRIWRQELRLPVF